MNIIFVEPDKDLSFYIDKIRVLYTDDEIHNKQKITPSPYTCLSYNHFSIPKFSVKGEAFISENKLQLTGPKISDDIYALHNRKLSQVLIEFSPTGFFCLFGQSPRDFVNRTISLSRLNKINSINDLLKNLNQSDNYISHIEILQDYLLTLVPRDFEPIDYINKAINTIDELSAKVTVHSLCKKIGIGERQFNRKFCKIVGISPIRFIKIRQLHFIINRMCLNHYNSISELAYDTGFYDPAHFSNSFKKLTKMTPGEFITSDEHIAMDYYSKLI